jgi:hypothetical protein
MGWDPNTLPEKVLRLLSPADRKSLGRGIMTADEAVAKAHAKSERELQNQIDNLLRLKGIVAIRSRMDKKTSTNVGTPDFLFAIDVQKVEVPIALEAKLGNERLSEEQSKMRTDMETPPNAWHYHVVRSVDDALAVLRRYGIT